MNGTKLALLIAGGAIATGIAISVARASSKRESCAKVTFDQAAAQRLVDAQANPATADGLTPESPAIEIFRRLFRASFPMCEFGPNDTTVIVGLDGSEFNWQNVVQSLKGKTARAIVEDPTLLMELFNVTGRMPGREGAAPQHPMMAAMQAAVTEALA